MLIPIAINRQAKTVTITDVDESLNFSDTREVTEKEFGSLFMAIGNQLEQFCCEGEHRSLYASKDESDTRVICLYNSNDTLSKETLVLMSNGETNTLASLYKNEKYKGNKDLDLLVNLGRQPIIRLKCSLTDNNGNRRFYTNTRGVVTVTKSEEMHFFVMLDEETGYPIPIIVCDSKVYWLSYVLSSNTSKEFGAPLVVRSKQVADLVSCGQGNWENLKNNFFEQTRFTYPIVEHNVLHRLLLCLNLISDRWVLPFYLVYRNWISSSSIRKIKFAGGAYWWLDKDENDAHLDFEDAISLFGMESERIRVIRDDRFYGMTTSGAKANEILAQTPISATPSIMIPRLQAFVDLSGLYIECGSLGERSTQICYYVNDIKGLSDNLIYLDGDFFDDNNLRFYFAPSDDINSLMTIVKEATELDTMRIYLNQEEWERAGKQEKLEELLALICIYQKGQSSTVRKTDNLALYFLCEAVRPKGELWVSNIRLETEVSFNTFRCADVLSNDNFSQKRAMTVYKMMLTGILKANGLWDNLDKSTIYNVVEHITSHSQEAGRADSISILMNKIVACMGGTLHEITLDRPFTQPITVAHILGQYANISINGYATPECFSVLSWADINIYRTYRQQLESEIKKAIQLLGDSSKLEVKALIPTKLQFMLWDKLDNFKKTLLPD